jgi:hypothetical protein
MMGLPFSSSVITTGIQKWRFPVVNDEGWPCISVKRDNGSDTPTDVRYIPEEITGMYLQHLKRAAEQELGTHVTDAIITVPAYFDEQQRVATVDAANIAGLKATLIDEAAVIAKASNVISEDVAKDVIVADIDETTFNVTILSIRNSRVAIKGATTSLTRPVKKKKRQLGTELGSAKFGEENLLKEFKALFEEKYDDKINGSRTTKGKISGFDPKLVKQFLETTTSVDDAKRNALLLSDFPRFERDLDELIEDSKVQIAAPFMAEIKRCIGAAKMQSTMWGEVLVLSKGTVRPDLSWLCCKIEHSYPDAKVNVVGPDSIIQGATESIVEPIAIDAPEELTRVKSEVRCGGTPIKPDLLTVRVHAERLQHKRLWGGVQTQLLRKKLQTSTGRQAAQEQKWRSIADDEKGEQQKIEKEDEEGNGIYDEKELFCSAIDDEHDEEHTSEPIESELDVALREVFRLLDELQPVDNTTSENRADEGSIGPANRRESRPSPTSTSVEPVKRKKEIDRAPPCGMATSPELNKAIATAHAGHVAVPDFQDFVLKELNLLEQTHDIMSQRDALENAVLRATANLQDETDACDRFETEAAAEKKSHIRAERAHRAKTLQRKEDKAAKRTEALKLQARRDQAHADELVQRQASINELGKQRNAIQNEAETRMHQSHINCVASRAQRRSERSVSLLANRQNMEHIMEQKLQDPCFMERTTREMEQKKLQDPRYLELATVKYGEQNIIRGRLEQLISNWMEAEERDSKKAFDAREFSLLQAEAANDDHAWTTLQATLKEIQMNMELLDIDGESGPASDSFNAASDTSSGEEEAAAHITESILIETKLLDRKEAVLSAKAVLLEVQNDAEVERKSIISQAEAKARITHQAALDSARSDEKAIAAETRAWQRCAPGIKAAEREEPAPTTATSTTSKCASEVEAEIQCRWPHEYLCEQKAKLLTETRTIVVNAVQAASFHDAIVRLLSAVEEQHYAAVQRSYTVKRRLVHDAELEEVAAAALKEDQHEREPALTKVDFSKNVLMWLHGDAAPPVYKKRFTEQLTRIAQGERTYMLAKMIKGCIAKIFETRLSMVHGGMRVLWQVRTQKGSGAPGDNATRSSIMVWCVVHHDGVKKALKALDVQSDESFKWIEGVYKDTPSLEGTVEGVNNHTHTPEIMIDPSKHTPHKVYTVESAALEAMTDENVDFRDWYPDLRLTKEERDVGLDPRTSVILGRSGTGKTVVVVARILQDVERDVKNERSSLFVARSVKLRAHVHREVESRKPNSTAKFNSRKQTLQKIGHGGYGAAMSTIDEIVSFLTEKLCDTGATNSRFQRQKLVTFSNFERDVWDEIVRKCHKVPGDISAALVWGEMRTFIKGSVTAATRGYALKEGEYVENPVHCRKREHDKLKLLKHDIFKIFERYQTYLTDTGSWDEMDRAITCCSALKREIEANRDKRGYLTGLGLAFDKIYVDEVQDANQAELAILMYCCCGPPNAMFFAGDTAQTIEQGANFNFNDTRIVAAKVFPEHKEANAIGKFKTLTHNYRSHKGILDVAADLVRQMCHYFPNGVDNVEDVGIALGPRPMIGMGKAACTEALSNERLVVLVRDDSPEMQKKYTRMVEEDDAINGRTHSIYGIREFKGLEETHIAIYGFFDAVEDPEIRKGWQTIFSPTDAKGEVCCKMETELKLLYTAVTRSRIKLIWIEPTVNVDDKTLPPVLESFNRWMKWNRLVTKFERYGDDPGWTDKQMSQRDWIVRGAGVVQMAFDWITKTSIYNLHEKDIEPKFNHAYKAFKAAGTEGQQYIETLDKQIKRIQREKQLVEDSRNLQQRIEEAAVRLKQPKFTSVEVGDVIMLTEEMHYDGCLVPEGTIGDVVQAVQKQEGAVIPSITLSLRSNQNVIFVKRGQHWRHVGVKSIDGKCEADLVQMVEKAIKLERIEDVLKLLQVARDLPSDKTECDQDEPNGFGWLSRRNALFASLIERCNKAIDE